MSRTSTAVAASPSREIDYDEANIRAVRNAWKKEGKSTAAPKQVFTLVQANAPCEIKVSKTSRKACVQALMG
jgi:hypothetical protein